MERLIKGSYMDQVIVLCGCGGSDHHISVLRDPDDGEVFFSVVPMKHGLWFRIKWGIAYILGRKDGWDDVRLDKNQMQKFIKALKEFTEEAK
jgi:hypothetical protein